VSPVAGLTARGELLVEVDVDRAGDVTVEVVGDAVVPWRAGDGEPPAHVEDDRRVGGSEGGGELGRADEDCHIPHPREAEPIASGWLWS
jgi:hypothetical protein